MGSVLTAPTTKGKELKGTSTVKNARTMAVLETRSTMEKGP